MKAVPRRVICVRPAGMKGYAIIRLMEFAEVDGKPDWRWGLVGFVGFES